jgi:predicted RNA methylase
MAAIPIPQPVMQVLEAAVANGDRLTLTGQLDRKLYEQVNKVLLSIGGKWNRSVKAHIFPEPVTPMIEAILETGSYSQVKQDFGQFDTPDLLAEQIARIADVGAGMSVLEPSAGIGNLAKAVRQFEAMVTCWEIDPKRAEALRGIAHSLNVGDFLAAAPAPAFDRVVMNPPFAGQADIDHVVHASKFLRQDGKLVAIMSASVTFRENAKTQRFREFVAHRSGTIRALPADSFKASGTSVNTCVVTLTA